MCGVTECPVTNLFFVSRGWQQGRESATNEDTLVTLVKQLETSSCVPAMVVQSPFGPLFLSLCVLHVDSVTFSPLEGNRVPCEPKLIILETFRLYSKLISCTRKISTLHLEFKCVCARAPFSETKLNLISGESAKNCPTCPNQDPPPAHKAGAATAHGPYPSEV